MIGLFKFLLTVALLVLLLCGVALAFLPGMIGKDDLNTIFARYTRDYGKEITIKGAAKVSLLPSISVSMQQVEIRDLHDDTVKPLYFDTVNIHADFTDLFLNKLGANIDLVSPLGSIRGRLETDRLQKLQRGEPTPVSLRLESPSKKAKNGVNILLITGNVIFAAGKEIGASNLKLQVGEGTRGNGSIHIALDKPVPAMTADLQFDALDANGIQAFTAPFLAQPKTDLASISEAVKPPQQVEGIAPIWSTDPIPFDALKSITAEIKASAKSMHIGAMQFEKLSFESVLKNGKLQANIKELEGYGGETVAEFTVDSTTQPPTVTFRETTRNLNLGQLLKDSTFTQKLTAQAEGSIALATRGTTQKALVEQLTGMVKLSLKEGNIAGLDIVRFVELTGDNLKELLNQPGVDTPFNQASATLEIHNGLFTNNDLLVTLPLNTLKGSGTLALPSMIVDYRVMPEAPANAVTQTASLLPVTITGDIRKPVILPDRTGLVVEGEQKLQEQEQVQQIPVTIRAPADQLKPVAAPVERKLEMAPASE